MTHTYQLKRMSTDPAIPIWIHSEGELRTDVITPVSYLEYKVEDEMLRLDQLMVRYIDGYLRKRRELRQKYQDLIGKYKGVNRFEIIHGWTTEERIEFHGLVKESLRRVREHERG